MPAISTLPRRKPAFAARATAMCLLIALLVGASAAQDRPDLSADFDLALAERAADAFLDAHAKDDRKRMDAIAIARRPDPWLVAHVLFVGTLSDPDMPPEVRDQRLAAMKKLAEWARRKPLGRGLLALVEKWQAASDECKAEILALHRFYESLRAAGGAAEKTAPLDPALAELIKSPISVTAVTIFMIQLTRGDQLRLEGRHEDAGARYEKIANLAPDIGWQALTMHGRSLTALMLFRMGRYCNSLNAATLVWRQAAALGGHDFAYALRTLTRMQAAEEQVRLFMKPGRHEDADLLAGIASGQGADTHLIAETLLRWIHDPDPERPWTKEQLRAALQDFEKLVDGSPWAAGVASLAKRWQERTDAGRRLEIRLKREVQAVARGFGVEPWDELLRRARQALDSAASAPSSLAAAQLELEIACIFQATGQHAEAADTWQKNADRAARADWIRGELIALDLEQHLDFDLNRRERRIAALHRYVEVSERLGEADFAAYHKLAEAYMAAFRYREASRQLIKSIRINPKKTDAEKGDAARALHQFGIVCFVEGKHRQALALLDQSVTIQQELGDSEFLAATLNTMGMCHQHLGQLERAQRLHERAYEQAKASGARDLAVCALIEQGNVLGAREKFREAVAVLENALRQAESLGDTRSITWIQSNLGVCHVQLGNHQAAIGYLKKSRAGSLSQGNRRAAAISLAELGTAYIGLAEYREALLCLTEGYKEKQATGNHAGANTTLTQLATLYSTIGYKAMALDLHRQAAREDPEPSPSKAAYSQWNIGHLLMSLGRYAEAYEKIEQALRECKRLGLRHATDSIENGFASLLNDLGHYERARDRLEKALARMDASSHATNQAMARLCLARTLTQLQRLDEARIHAEKARELFTRAGDPLRAATALHRLGMVCHAQDRLDEALRYYEQARDRLTEIGNSLGAASVTESIALVHLCRGEDELALACYRDALRAMEEVGEVGLTAGPLHGIATVALSRERLEEAVDCARKCLDLMSRQGVGLAEEEAFEVNARIRDVAEVAMTAIAEQLERGDQPARYEDAFAFLERSRGLVLAEGVLNRDGLRRQCVAPDLFARYCAIRAQVRELTRRLLKAKAAGAAPEAVRKAQAGRDEAYHRFQEVSADVERSTRRVDEITAPSPPRLAVFRQGLGADTAFLEFLITDKKALVLAVTRETAVLRDLGEAPVVQKAVENYLDLVSGAGAAGRRAAEVQQAGRLFDLLLAPLEPVLRDKKRLVVAPDGGLAFLPFEALVQSEKRPASRVIERWEVTYVPSGTVHRMLREEIASREPGTGLVALGDPDYPAAVSAAEPATVMRGAELRGLAALRRLPESRVEVETIAALFPDDRRTILLGKNASVANLKKALDAADGRLACLHLACHGHVDRKCPRLTGLFLSGGELLTLADVYRLSIPADLAVLSACQTSGGAVSRPEGVIGLVRGFFLAGCPRVVVSNWCVQDASTRALMASFYRHMLDEKLPAGAALRAAKLEMMKGAQAWRSPYHWAAFTLWGVRD